jgi:hypothetical protein
MMVKTNSVKMNENIAKEIKVTDNDTIYLGKEPLYTDQKDRKMFIMHSLTWYSKFLSKKEAKEFLLEYLEKQKSDSALIKKIKSVPESEFNCPLSWMARLSMRGLVLTEDEIDRLKNESNRLLNSKNKEIVIDIEEKSKVNVQEIMKEKAKEAAGELEGHFDQYIKDGCKNTFTLKVVDELSKFNIFPHHVYILTDIWNKKKTEFESVLSSTDKDLLQGYSNFSKTQLKNCVKYCDLTLSDLNSYLNIKKISRAPRTKKTVPIEKKVKDFKYMKEHTEGTLTLTSVSPTKIHGCTECYLYDTELRKLIYLVADSYAKELTIKGNTILGFDTNKSQVKTIRKPEVQIKEFMKLGKPSGRKYFDEIKTVSVTPKGRSNDRTIILKAW